MTPDVAFAMVACFFAGGVCGVVAVLVGIRMGANIVQEGQVE
jgi:hypothetical protein